MSADISRPSTPSCGLAVPKHSASADFFQKNFLREELRSRSNFSEIVGESDSIWKVLRSIDIVASTEYPLTEARLAAVASPLHRPPPGTVWCKHRGEFTSAVPVPASPAGGQTSGVRRRECDQSQKSQPEHAPDHLRASGGSPASSTSCWDRRKFFGCDT